MNEVDWLQNIANQVDKFVEKNKVGETTQINITARDLRKLLAIATGKVMKEIDTTPEASYQMPAHSAYDKEHVLNKSYFNK